MSLRPPNALKECPPGGAPMFPRDGGIQRIIDRQHDGGRGWLRRERQGQAGFVEAPMAERDGREVLRVIKPLDIDAAQRTAVNAKVVEQAPIARVRGGVALGA